MSRYAISAEHRSRDAIPQIADPVTALPSQPTVKPGRYAGLSPREARVKQILLQELSAINEHAQGNSGFNYADHQGIVKKLDASYLDEQIDGMREKLRANRKPDTSSFHLWSIAFLLCIVSVKSFYDGAFWTGMGAVAGLICLCLFLYLVGVRPERLQREATRRRLFIFEALRELSDADEIDVILDKATRDADRLIEQIVTRELEIAARYKRFSRFST